MIEEYYVVKYDEGSAALSVLAGPVGLDAAGDAAKEYAVDYLADEYDTERKEAESFFERRLEECDGEDAAPGEDTYLESWDLPDDAPEYGDWNPGILYAGPGRIDITCRNSCRVVLVIARSEHMEKRYAGKPEG